MRNIWKMVKDSWTITVEQNVWFRGGLCPEKIHFKIADLWSFYSDNFHF